MSRKVAPRDLRKGMVIIERSGRREIRRLIRVQSVTHDCEKGGTHVNELSLIEPLRCYHALAVVEVK